MRIRLAGALIAVFVAGCGSIAVQKDGGASGGGSVDAGADACISDPMATTCAGKCGTLADNCNRKVDCGTSQCVAPQTCGGGGTANVCGCTPADPTQVCGTQICGTLSN